MLHVWLIHKRLIMEGKEGQRLQEALFDQLWEDTSNRIRSKGIGEMSVRSVV
jgi:cytochrome b pre-mRNA-processing protein 3